MGRHTGRLAARIASAVAVGLGLTCASMGVAVAADGSIGHVEPTDDGVQVMFSVPGIPDDVVPDVATVSATIDGDEVEATAVLADGSNQSIRRTTILALDVSRSMQGEKFEEAREAARSFLDAAPLDVSVGIVAFAGDVRVVQEPTRDRAAAKATLDELELTFQTRLYEGVREAVLAAGEVGQRSILVLSDGADTSEVPLEEVSSDIQAAEIQVDVVALAQSPKNMQNLEAIATAGGGVVLEADDPQALSQVFESEALALAKQVQVTAKVPADLEASEGSLAISIDAGGEVYEDSAYVSLRKAPGPLGAVLADPNKVVSTAGGFVTPTMMFAALGAIGLAMLVVLLGAFGVLTPRTAQGVEDRIKAYTLSGGAGRSGSSMQRISAPGLAGSARNAAEKALASNKGLEASLGAKLDAAGMSLKPAEWLLAQVGIAFASALVGVLLGNLLLAVLLLGLGALVPYLYLGFKKSRRVKAFNNQLADTLQLMSGSLSAGLSMAQSVDTVVREGSEPITSEFKRALIEARLGVPIEDALEGVAERMQSEDFRWVIMAIRIQREVGGNLAEVLNQVAATIRERAYLRRQVKTLSAEGVLSAWILGALPVGMGGYLVLTRPEYLQPLITTLFGWVLLLIAAVLMAVGALWMRKIVQMEV